MNLGRILKDQICHGASPIAKDTLSHRAVRLVVVVGAASPRHELQNIQHIGVPQQRVLRKRCDLFDNVTIVEELVQATCQAAC